MAEPIIYTGPFHSGAPYDAVICFDGTKSLRDTIEAAWVEVETETETVSNDEQMIDKSILLVLPEDDPVRREILVRQIKRRLQVTPSVIIDRYFEKGGRALPYPITTPHSRLVDQLRSRVEAWRDQADQGYIAKTEAFDSLTDENEIYQHIVKICETDASEGKVGATLRLDLSKYPGVESRLKTEGLDMTPPVQGSMGIYWS